MVAEVNLVDVASIFALDDTKKKYNMPENVSPENWVHINIDTLSAMEYYNIQYEYYFGILLENTQ